ncbi:MAG: hypothetical protein RLZ98_3607, partial [Pseudomonadota bacterium]
GACDDVGELGEVGRDFRKYLFRRFERRGLIALRAWRRLALSRWGGGRSGAGGGCLGLGAQRGSGEERRQHDHYDQGHYALRRRLTHMVGCRCWHQWSAVRRLLTMGLVGCVHDRAISPVCLKLTVGGRATDGFRLARVDRLGAVDLVRGRSGGLFADIGFDYDVNRAAGHDQVLNVVAAYE